MIQLPRRSVTRFFIPLIDVLILLFCMFLLMPFVKEEGGVESGEEPTTLPPTQARALKNELDLLRAEVAELRQAKAAPAELRAEIDRLRNEKIAALRDRLLIRTFQI